MGNKSGQKINLIIVTTEDILALIPQLKKRSIINTKWGNRDSKWKVMKIGLLKRARRVNIQRQWVPHFRSIRHSLRYIYGTHNERDNKCFFAGGSPDLLAPMLPTTMMAPMMPMRLYLGTVLDSCLRITMCRSSWETEPPHVQTAQSSLHRENTACRCIPKTYPFPPLS